MSAKRKIWLALFRDDLYWLVIMMMIGVDRWGKYSCTQRCWP